MRLYCARMASLPAVPAATILVVDDAPSNREAMALLLRDEGFQVMTAGDAAGALAALAGAHVDLVLLDVSMPKMSGLQLLDHVRRNRSPTELPIIMVTASAGSEGVVEALGRGANDYVTKPVDAQVLLARVRTQLEVGRLARLKDEFLRVASHDLKNPLTAILGAADALTADFPTGTPMNDEGRWYIGALKRRALQMRRIIGDFLDLGALQEGRLALELAPVDLRALVAQSVEDNLAYARGKAIALALAPGPTPAPVRADAPRMTQVIDNLVGNAIKFSPRGSAVEVAVVDAGPAVRVEVRDHGPGFAEEDLGRLFVRHARIGNRPTGGESSTGVGLALCRELVELHGGRIGARNADGGGALFWFELPR